MCNSGVGLTPTVDSRVHHFSAGGLYNGLVLLIDDESKTYWDHITGAAVHGPLTGAQLDQWGIQMTTAGALKEQEPKRQESDLLVYRSHPSLWSRALGWFMNLPFLSAKFPPGFRRTMSDVDTRLDEMSIGLGVVTRSTQRFYPKDRIGVEIGAGIEDEIDGRELRVQIGELDAVPSAVWSDGTRPLQLFSRWYGFSLTYPGCEVYSATLR